MSGERDQPERPAGGGRRPTLEEVARAAGVSRSTTSRVLNDHPSVRPDVRARVQRVMSEVGYVPDRVARGLRSGRTGIIGLVIPQSPSTVFGDAYFSALVTAVVGAGQDGGSTVAIVLVDDAGSTIDPSGREPNTAAQPGDRAGLVQRLAAGRLLDGVVSTASVDDDHVPSALQAAGVPVVVIGEPVDSSVPSVDVDNVTGGRLAVEHLAEVGRRRLAVLAGPTSNASARDRRTGARAAATAVGATVVVDVAVSAFSEAAGSRSMRQVLAGLDGDTFDGLVAGSDAIAVGAMAALRDQGLEVPGDVAVVGFDDLAPARLAVPPLTTVVQSIEEVGRAAVGSLLDLLETPAEPTDPVRRTVLDVHLVVRQSTSAPT